MDRFLARLDGLSKRRNDDNNDEDTDTSPEPPPKKKSIWCYFTVQVQKEIEI